MNPRAATSLLILVVVSLVPVSVALAEPEVLLERWYIVELGGQRSGYALHREQILEGRV